MNKVQAEASRYVAMICVFLVLVFAGLEATHVHADGQRPASSCLVCVSAHANAPALTVHSLPTLRAVATLAVPLETTGQSTAVKLTFFIRPPPAA